MDKLNVWLGILGGLLGLLMLLGSTLAIIRVSYFKAQIESLRGDRDDLMTRVEILEKDKERADAKTVLINLELEKEKEKVRVLENVVTAKVELSAVSQQLTALVQVINMHHRDTMALLGGKRADDAS